jgi:dTDP-D-glucose 4,6-dehydratase
VNLGAGREITIRALCETIAELCGFRGAIAWDASQPDGQPRRMLDVSRAKAAFGFEARTEFEAGLRETVRWWLGARGARQNRQQTTENRGRAAARQNRVQTTENGGLLGASEVEGEDARGEGRAAA